MSSWLPCWIVRIGFDASNPKMPRNSTVCTSRRSSASARAKRHKRYEFGQKVAVATTNRSNWFVAAHLLKNNPYDGHTLSETLATVENVTGVAVTDAYVDKGYRGHGYTGTADVHIAGHRRKNTTRAERKRRRRRSAIEPKIGHLKSDHRMDRCFLARLRGDAINAVLAAAGANLRKLLGLLRLTAGRFVSALIAWLERLAASRQLVRIAYLATA